MGKTIVTGLMPEQIIFYQDQLKELIEKPLKKTGDEYYLPEHVIQKCITFEWQCWVACSEAEKIDCVFITYITVYPTGHKEFTVFLVGGEKIEQWLKQAWELFKKYAKAHQCKKIVCMGRKGWRRELIKIDSGKLEEQYAFTIEV
jgi:hypothetical protein